MLSLRYLLTSCTLFTINLLNPAIAFAQADVVETDIASSESTTEGDAKTSKDYQVFTSDGSPMQIEHLGISIAAPATWEVKTNTGTLSVVMHEPREEAPSYDKPKYQRNITVAAIHRASPIDELRATELKDQLTKAFTADSLVSNFQIIEHKFFNYKGTNDGLLVYSSLNIQEYPMMQMHVLVSGEEKQFLMTYTDLADRFSDPALGAFDKAWNTMVSMEVTGAAPMRQDEYLRYGAIGGGVFLLCLTGLILRRRTVKKGYDADSEYESFDSDGGETSMFATLAGEWQLPKNEAGEGDFGLEFSRHAPRTRQTEYVSNY
jgi:hypothetical protein